MRAKSGYDLVLAVSVAVAQIVLSMGAAYGQSSREELDAPAFALLTAGPAALAFRRRRPVVASAVALLVTYVYTWLDYPLGPVYLAPVIVLSTLVLDGRRRAAWVLAAVTWAVFLAYGAVGDGGAPAGIFHDLAITAFILLVMVVAELASIVRERRAQQQRAVAEEMRRQASEERLTMAQELHDVLAHNISLIHVQAATALHLIDDHPEQARTALATIKGASKDVLGEMRSVLNVLRDGAPRSPTAGLDRLDELAERCGLDVTLDRQASRPLSPQVERAAYRIVQESLTNAARHAPGAKVRVLLAYGPRELAVQVTDTGPTTPAVLAGQGGGNGIPGMRERASALGGTLLAGPVGAGFQVSARLPLPEETT
ncbi:sensor histidine kinase [Nonomuraea sp. NPDC047897]|uniref:sensor histidine kinase n=1 Tax=Nonomuraea sp. NPDC047897 TaxID=3364346 RepID=UPI00371E19DF